jgi:hypothetical protein
MKIVVGTNTLTEIQQPAYVNHCQLWFRLGRSYPQIDFILSAPPRMSIDRMRNMTAKVAIQCNADYVLFIDDDVIVPPNYGLQQLLDCDADVAAGRVCVRGWPFDYMVFNKSEEDQSGLYIQKTLPDHGIVECDAVGFSFVLIRVSLLKRMTEPWFVTGTNNTEDIYFCKRARSLDEKISIKVNCDCACGHILWPEVIFESNREAYKDYMARVNPSLLEQLDPTKQGQDRGEEYLKMVVKTVGAS